MMVSSRKPEWIRYKTPSGSGFLNVKRCIDSLGLHTICTEARCPNAGECFAGNTATFLILGNMCTRDCLYCAVEKGKPLVPEPDEPERVAEAVFSLGLKYAVITSVTRDDLDDGGASYFAETVNRIKERVPGCGIELLTPDFKHSLNRSLDIIRESDPDVLNHNIETVKAVYTTLRPSGDYMHSLKLMRTASGSGLKVKSGLMIGFGESMDDIVSTMNDLRGVGCAILTVGQYLSPVKTGYPVQKYYHPDEFESIRERALGCGFEKVYAAPNVRSSYHASSVSADQVP